MPKNGAALSHTNGVIYKGSLRFDCSYVDKINRALTNMKNPGYDKRTPPPTPIALKPKNPN